MESGIFVRSALVPGTFSSLSSKHGAGSNKESEDKMRPDLWQGHEADRVCYARENGSSFLLFPHNLTCRFCEIESPVGGLISGALWKTTENCLFCS
jgi:hypothetical protein